jgi:SAM-dependent methyltransferase
VADSSPSPSGSDSQRPVHDFDVIYATGSPPWDIGRPQPAFDALARSSNLIGRVLDAGCGTGEHALMAAASGHEALGVDLSERAIELARAKALDRGIPARFKVTDALRLGELGEQFDTVLDAERVRYVHSLAEVLPPGAQLHILCFSDRQPGDWGPRRVTQGEIEAALGEGWTIECIEPAVIELTWDPAGALAWNVSAIRA